MGKIKNWKVTKRQKGWIVWENIPSTKEIWVIRGNKYGTKVKDFKKWVVYKHAIVERNGFKGMFTKKSDAIKFAVKYMKKHPNG